MKMTLLYKIHSLSPGYSKTGVKGKPKNSKTKILMTSPSFVKVESIAECSALSDNWSWKPIFDLFESGCLTQVLLYVQASHFVMNV